MARKNKRQVNDSPDIDGELATLADAQAKAQAVVDFLYSRITSKKMAIDDRLKALTRWAPALESLRGVTKDRIRYKMASKDVPIDTITINKECGLSEDERSNVINILSQLNASASGDSATED